MDTSFLLPEEHSEYFEEFGFRLYETLSEKIFMRQWLARKKTNNTYEIFRNVFDYYESISRQLDPDIILEDNEPLSVLMAEKYQKPRISVFRTGFFRNIDHQHRNPKHCHSMERGKNNSVISLDWIVNSSSETSNLMINSLKNTHLQMTSILLLTT